MEESAIRRELDLLHQVDRDLRVAISDLDNHGSRGVLTLQGQVVDLIKDLGDLRLTFAQHERVHEDERQERKTNRRWIIGTVVGGMGAFGGVFTLLFEILLHLHGG